MRRVRRLLQLPRRRSVRRQMERQGWERYNRDDFAPGTRGAEGICKRNVPVPFAGGVSHDDALAWQRWSGSRNRTLLAYCEPCAWRMMVEQRARALREARSHPADAAELDS